MGLFDIFKKKQNSVNIPKNDSLSITPMAPCNNVAFGGVQVSEVVPIEERIKKQQPTCDGLYPHEVLVLQYSPKFYESENEFAGFWWFKYGINDVESVLRSLAKRGFIKRGSIKEAIKIEKMPTIKAELQKRKLKSAGKKADLIDRLVEFVPEEELALIFSRRPYVLTEKGESILKEYEWIPFIHAHSIEDLNIWNLTELVQSPPYMKYRDKIWGYLNQRGIEYVQSGSFGLYRNCRLKMSEFVDEEGKYRNAFSLLCEVAAYDLSGLSNSGCGKDIIRIHSKYYFPYEESTAKMAPGITDKMKKYANEFRWTEEELHENIASSISKRMPPFSLFTAQECADIVVAEINEDKERLNGIYNSAEKRLKKYIN